MRTRLGAAAAALALLAGCAHSLDRRWDSATFTETPAFRIALTDPHFRDPSLAHGAFASVSVYSYPTPASGKVDGDGGFARTLVVSVAKDPHARPGERLMRTIVEIVPDGGFRFAGYKVVATDTRTLDVEHVEQSSAASLQANLSAKPPVPAGIQAGLTGGVTNGQTSSADIASSFENLSVDITPSLLRITRESERNLDLTGNTIIALSLVPAPDASGRSEGERFLLGSAPSLYRGDEPLPPVRASLHLSRLHTLARCPVTASVRMLYQYRKIEAGERNYQEGTQAVRIVSDATLPAHATLIQAGDLTGPLYGILTQRGLVEAANHDARLPLVFADYDSARDMARWMAATHARGIAGGAQLLLGGDQIPEPYPASLTAMRIDRPANAAQCALAPRGE